MTEKGAGSMLGEQLTTRGSRDAWSLTNVPLPQDSNVVNRTEFYRQGVALPDRTVGAKGRSVVMGDNDFVVGGMLLLLGVLAFIICKGHEAIRWRMKDFFLGRRHFGGEQPEGTSSEALHVFLLTVIGSVSAALMLFDDLAVENAPILPASMPYWLIGAFFVAYMGAIYLKVGLYACVNWVFFDEESGLRWLRGYLTLTSLVTFFFYPLALMDLLNSVRHEIVIGIVILVVFFYELTLFYQLFVNFKVRKYGYLLIILYFCSVELMPTLVLGHLAVGLGSNDIVKNLFY